MTLTFKSEDETLVCDHLNVLRHYGIPEKFIAFTQQSYYNSQIRVIQTRELTPPFSLKTGVRQGCILSPMLFLLVIDWTMTTTTEGSRTGIQWFLLSQLHDLDFADDIALLSRNHKHAQDKVESLATTAGTTSLTIKKKHDQDNAYKQHKTNTQSN